MRIETVTTNGQPGMYGSLWKYTEAQQKAMKGVYDIIYKAAESKSRVRELKKANLDVGYWLDREEIFARAFAQWVMKKVSASDKKMQEDMKKYLKPGQTK